MISYLPPEALLPPAAPLPLDVPGLLVVPVPGVVDVPVVPLAPVVLVPDDVLPLPVVLVPVPVWPAEFGEFTVFGFRTPALTGASLPRVPEAEVPWSAYAVLAPATSNDETIRALMVFITFS